MPLRWNSGYSPESHHQSIDNCGHLAFQNEDVIKSDTLVASSVDWTVSSSLFEPESVQTWGCSGKMIALKHRKTSASPHCEEKALSVVHAA